METIFEYITDTEGNGHILEGRYRKLGKRDESIQDIKLE